VLFTYLHTTFNFFPELLQALAVRLVVTSLGTTSYVSTEMDDCSWVDRLRKCTKPPRPTQCDYPSMGRWNEN